MNNTATNSTPCPTVRKQIGKTTYIVRVHFSQTAKETMEDKALIFNTQTVVLVVLNGEAYVEGNHIFLHCSSTSA